MKHVRLVGLDFGTTTSRCVAASANLSQNSVTGRHELSDVREDFPSSTVLTPFRDDQLDLARLESLLDEWLDAAAADSEEIFGGGALVTGLAARQSNSAGLIDLLRSRVKDALVATADDPSLEAWLAFQANAAAISRAHPGRWVVNLDIGGGTTNIALGRDGNVVRTGALFIGARHVAVEPGSYRIVRLSPYAQAVFEHLKIDADVSDCLRPDQVDELLDWSLELIEAALTGNAHALKEPVARRHEQVALELPADFRAIVSQTHRPDDVIYCLSGGVGELVYEFRKLGKWPGTTAFGDLGVDLAQRFATSTHWAARLANIEPPHLGRATVYGLLLHAMQVSGSTVYLSDPALLPLRDVPIFGQVDSNSTERAIQDIFQLIAHSEVGGCVPLALQQNDASTVRQIGERIATVLKNTPPRAGSPLVLLVEQNVGKALGGYVSNWGASPVKLVVLDEIDVRDARFVQIGPLRNQVVTVSFYGMN